MSCCEFKILCNGFDLLKYVEVAKNMLFLDVCLLSFRRVPGLLNLGEGLSLDADNLPSPVHISPVQPGYDPAHHDIMMDIWHWFNLESDKIRFVAVSA